MTHSLSTWDYQHGISGTWLCSCSDLCPGASLRYPLTDGNHTIPFSCPQESASWVLPTSSICVTHVHSSAPELFSLPASAENPGSGAEPSPRRPPSPHHCWVLFQGIYSLIQHKDVQLDVGNRDQQPVSILKKNTTLKAAFFQPARVSPAPAHVLL